MAVRKRASGGPGREASTGQGLRHLYREREDQPESVSHFGIRYTSFAKLKRALTQLDERLDPELHGRLKVVQVSNLPAGTSFLTEDVMSAFVVTDVIAAGLLTLGQTIELQAQQQASESAASPCFSPSSPKKNTRCCRIYPLKVAFGQFTWPIAPSAMVRVAFI